MKFIRTAIPDVILIEPEELVTEFHLLIQQKVDDKYTGKVNG